MLQALFVAFKIQDKPGSIIVLVMYSPTFAFLLVVIRIGSRVAQADRVGFVHIEQQHAMVSDALVRIALTGTTFVFFEIGFAEAVAVADAGVESEVLGKLELHTAIDGIVSKVLAILFDFFSQPQ